MANIDVEQGINDETKYKDELQFQDFSLDEDERSTSGSQTHKFTDFPHTADSDDESSDKTGLLKDEDKKASNSFWTFGYYQQFFDVDSKQVFRRVTGSMLPIPGRNYLVTHIRPNPDLYGPFWICLTLVFTTAIAGNMANYLQSASTNYKWKYDFHKVTFAATAIFSYWWLIPLGLFGILWWRGKQTSVRYSFLEIICVYGYSLAIYIPISILWVIQVNWLQWLLVIIGALLSGSVLIITFWPAVRDDTRQVALIIMAVIFIFHAALAAGFVMYFFHVPSSSSGVTPTTISPNVTSTVHMRLSPRLEKQLHSDQFQQVINPEYSNSNKHNNVNNDKWEPTLPGKNNSNQRPAPSTKQQTIKIQPASATKQQNTKIKTELDKQSTLKSPTEKPTEQNEKL